MQSSVWIAIETRHMRNPGVLGRRARSVRFTITDTPVNLSATHAKSSHFPHTDGPEHLPVNYLTVPVDSVNQLRRSVPVRAS